MGSVIFGISFYGMRDSAIQWHSSNLSEAWCALQVLRIQVLHVLAKTVMDSPREKFKESGKAVRSKRRLAKC
jgi:hypothetical protein